MSAFRMRMDVAENRNFTGARSPTFCRSEAQKARAFHRSIKGYQPTPLLALDAFAQMLGVAKVLVKDESQRFGLNAFKMLGGSYAIARLLCERYDINIADFTIEKFRAAGYPKATFATTTDGNHGRGVAWSARELGQHAVIYMPQGSSQERQDHITRLGAECIVTDMNYDDTVRYSLRIALERNWEVVQDTSWDGYTRIPTWIMQGYSTLADEAVEQMLAMGIKRPTHVFLQAGVGALAAGVLGYLVDVFGAKNMHTVVVEPELASCLYLSGIKGDIVKVGGRMATIMAGLACGEPNPVGWPLLRDCVSQFVSCADNVAALGMRVLGNPVDDDPRIVSGESGAIGMGVLSAVHFAPDRQALLRQFKLDKNSVVLLISTEGDTDQRGYREVVWEGRYPCA